MELFGISKDGLLFFFNYSRANVSRGVMIVNALRSIHCNDTAWCNHASTYQNPDSIKDLNEVHIALNLIAKII